MAEFIAMPPVTLTFTVTINGYTEGGKCRGIPKSEVKVAATGKDAEFFKVVVTKWGDLLAIDTRRSKNPEDRKAAAAIAAKNGATAPPPAPLTATEKAQIPANGTKGKGKARPAAEPAAPAAPDMAQMFAMFQQFMAGQK